MILPGIPAATAVPGYKCRHSVRLLACRLRYSLTDRPPAPSATKPALLPTEPDRVASSPTDDSLTYLSIP